jgi:hypothetical protein
VDSVGCVVDMLVVSHLILLTVVLVVFAPHTVDSVGYVASHKFCGLCWLCCISDKLRTVDCGLSFTSYILRTLLVVLPLRNTADSVGYVVPHILWKSFDCVPIVCTVDGVGCVAPHIYCFSSVAPCIYCGQWCCTSYILWTVLVVLHLVYVYYGQ